MGDLNRRKGVIMDSSVNGDDAIIQSEVPLNNMVGGRIDVCSDPWIWPGFESAAAHVV